MADILLSLTISLAGSPEELIITYAVKLSALKADREVNFTSFLIVRTVKSISVE